MKKLIPILLGLAFILTACGSPQEPAIPTTGHERPAEIPNPTIITISGIVESTETRNVYSNLPLTIDHVYVKVGDFVEAGQPLAALDAISAIEDLTLLAAQQTAAIEMARITGENNLRDAERMLNEATRNISRNTNFNILSAEAALTAARAHLQLTEKNHEIALQYHEQGSNPQITGAESLVRSARIELEEIQRAHSDTVSLYEFGIVAAEAVRQSEIALTHAENMYADALASYETAGTFLNRTVEQSEIALAAARSSHRDAQEMLRAARSAANQEVEALRSLVTITEATTNLEQLELALEQTLLQLSRHQDDATITAPVSGTITSVIAREGAMATGLMFIIEDTANLRVTTGIREYDIAQVTQGMEVTITSAAAGSAEYNGVITRINPAATPFAPVVEFETEVAVAAENTSLRIGMNARVHIPLP